MLKIFIIWLMRTKLYKWLLVKQIPFIRFSLNATSMRGDKYHKGYSLLQKGMIIGSIDTRKLTGILIPKVTGGVLSHAALCISKRDPIEPNKEYYNIAPRPGHGQGLEIVEMTHLDFTYSDFFDLCHESERIVIMDCLDWDKEYKNKVIDKSLELRLAEYDGSFEMESNNFLYCSELIYKADHRAGNGSARLKVNLEDLMGLGRPYLSPDGLLCGDNIRVVWDSEGQLTGMLGSQVREIIFKEKSNDSKLG